MAWALNQVSILLWRGNLLVWEEILPVYLSASRIDIRAGRSRKERKERGLFHPYATVFLTLKTRCVSIREPINKSWMELETALVNENFNELQTALAPLQADCDDVLSQSRLGPSSFLLSPCCSLLFVCRLLYCLANERSQWRQCKTEVCCVGLSHNWTSDYMDIYIFNGMIGI